MVILSILFVRALCLVSEERGSHLRRWVRIHVRGARHVPGGSAIPAADFWKLKPDMRLSFLSSSPRRGRKSSDDRLQISQHGRSTPVNTTIPSFICVQTPFPARLCSPSAPSHPTTCLRCKPSSSARCAPSAWATTPRCRLGAPSGMPSGRTRGLLPTGLILSPRQGPRSSAAAGGTGGGHCMAGTKARRMRTNGSAQAVIRRTSGRSSFTLTGRGGALGPASCTPASRPPAKRGDYPS